MVAAVRKVEGCKLLLGSCAAKLRVAPFHGFERSKPKKGFLPLIPFRDSMRPISIRRAVIDSGGRGAAAACSGSAARPGQRAGRSSGSPGHESVAAGRGPGIHERAPFYDSESAAPARVSESV